GSHLKGGKTADDPDENNGIKPTVGTVNFTSSEMQEWLNKSHDVIDAGANRERSTEIALSENIIPAQVVEGYRILCAAALEGSDEWLALVERVNNGEITLREAIQKITPKVNSYIEGKPLLGIKLAADSGYGATGPIIAALFQDMGAEFTDIGGVADYSLFVHDANPNNPDNLVNLVALVADRSAMLGQGYDVDGDRLGVVTQRGQILRGDDISSVIAPVVIREAIKKAGKEGIRGYKPVIVLNVLCSDRLKEVIKKAGGIPIESAVGFNQVKEAMTTKLAELYSQQYPGENDLQKGQVAEMGVEISSHIMFRENQNADDAFFAVIKLLQVLREKAEEYKEENEDVPEDLLDVLLDETNNSLGIAQDHHSGEWRTPMISNEARISVSQEIGDHYRNMAEQSPDKYRIRNTLDGVKIDILENGKIIGFLGVRPSGTSPEMVIAINSLVSEDVFKRIKQDFFTQLAKHRDKVKIDKLEPASTYMAQAKEAFTQIDAVDKKPAATVIGNSAILVTQYHAMYPWAGKANAVLAKLKGMIAEIWSGVTVVSARNPQAASKINDTDITLKQFIEANPNALSLKGNYTEKPFFVKTLATRFPDKIYMGFNEKIKDVGKERFTEWLKDEWENISRLKFSLKTDLTREEFERYLGHYEEWAIGQGDNKWALTTSDETINRAVSAMRQYFPDSVNVEVLFDDIARTRKNITSVLNEIVLEDGMVIQSLAGYMHGIFGLSLQTHPKEAGIGISGLMELPKNEAWIVKVVTDDNGQKHTFLVEPQQTSDNTHSLADYFTPIVWDAEQGNPKIRKTVTNADIDHWVNNDLFWDDARVVAKPEEFILQPKDITPEGAQNAKLESLIPASKVLPGTERITLNSGSVAINNDSGVYNELLIVEGKAEVRVEGREPVTLENGGSVFIPATVDKYTVISDGKAEVIRTYPLEEAFGETKTPVRVVLSEGKKVEGTDTALYTSSVVMSLGQNGNVTAADELAMIGNESVPAPGILAGREHMIVVTEGSVALTEPDSGKEIATLTAGDVMKIAQGTEYKVQKPVSAGADKKAVVRFDYAKSGIEEDLYAVFDAVNRNLPALSGNKVDLILPAEMFKKGGRGDVGSKEWEERQLNEMLGGKDIVKIHTYNSAAFESIADINIRPDAVGIVGATGNNIKSTGTMNSELQRFMEVNRVLPISDQDNLAEGGLLLARKIEGAALIQALLSKNAIESNQSIAEDARTLMTQLTGKSVPMTALYYMLPYKDVKFLVTAIENASEDVVLLMSFMQFKERLVEMLGLKPMKPLTQDLQKEIENRMKALWSV
ncbi:MAG: hypothetical protein KKG84_05715, partial [Candidatus Omnitrophica bacterium]|nr:hypothetical protein [Candidatus Omnitrophota bacterium]